LPSRGRWNVGDAPVIPPIQTNGALVLVAVGVLVRVAVLVGVLVRVAVGVFVAVLVRVAVLVGVLVGIEFRALSSLMRDLVNPLFVIETPVLCKIVRISLTVPAGFFWRSVAHAPVTWGVAIDVPS